MGDLYEDYRRCDGQDCQEDPALLTDYECRYSRTPRDCYCCGALFHYTEQGSICTRFCPKAMKSVMSPRFCQRRLVVLPYNWGDNFPDTVTLDDGRRRSPRNRRGRTATQVAFPYDESAPTACPQNPYMTEAMAKNHSAMNLLPPTRLETSTQANTITQIVTTSSNPEHTDTTTPATGGS